MIRLVLIRHGQSEWNKQNRFTGWTDVPLSEQGVEEAREAGRNLKKHEFTFDLAFTSYLRRATDTLKLVLEELGLQNIEVQRSWRLNEKHYGALQGLYKDKEALRHGEQQVFRWRRVFDCRPPRLHEDDVRHPKNDPLYKDVNPEELPATESLQDVVSRVTPYWEEVIAPALMSGRKVIISAHGNSLRALVKFLDGIPDDVISRMNIPTGVPLVYEFDDDLNVIKHYYLADPDVVKQLADQVANQGRVR